MRVLVTKHKGIIFKFILSMGLLIWSILNIPVAAFQNAGVSEVEAGIIYLRNSDTHQFQLISLTDTVKVVLDVDPGACYSISPSGEWFAITDQNRGNLRIISLLDGKTVQEQDWQAAWQTCSFSWNGDISLEIATGDSASRRYTQLDVFTGAMTVAPATPRAQAVNLTDLASHDFRLLSPDKASIVYNRCTSANFIALPDGGNACADSGQLVIYDLLAQQDIALLTNTSQSQFVVDDYANLAFAFSGISWSPTGRYLAYLTTPSAADQLIPQFNIYDLETSRYLTTDFEISGEIDRFRDFRWAADESKLAFWSFSYERADKQLVVFNLFKEELTAFSISYQPAETQWVWHSDYRSISFIDDQSNLISIDSLTGEAKVLDSGVWDIVKP